MERERDAMEKVSKKLEADVEEYARRLKASDDAVAHLRRTCEERTAESRALKLSLEKFDSQLHGVVGENRKLKLELEKKHETESELQEAMRKLDEVTTDYEMKLELARKTQIRQLQELSNSSTETKQLLQTMMTGREKPATKQDAGRSSTL